MTGLNPRAALGAADVVFITLDTLRYDVAVTALRAGNTPNLAAILPGGAWEARHTPASFTFAAHQAFFAGFLPTPARPRAENPPAHERLFAAAFPGSETTAPDTLVFETPDIVTGFAAAGYHTLCIGGTGFFNKRSPLGTVLPSLFTESFWDDSLGVTAIDSAKNQVACAMQAVARVPMDRRVFLFMNMSACHPPHAHHIPGARTGGVETQGAALQTIDAALPPLLSMLRRRADVLTIICSDHGTCFGEDGYEGHRIGHDVVWTVPYMETLLAREASA